MPRSPVARVLPAPLPIPVRRRPVPLPLDTHQAYYDTDAGRWVFPEEEEGPDFPPAGRTSPGAGNPPLVIPPPVSTPSFAPPPPVAVATAPYGRVDGGQRTATAAASGGGGGGGPLLDQQRTRVLESQVSHLSRQVLAAQREAEELRTQLQRTHTHRPAATTAAAAAEDAQPSAWTCHVCTFENRPGVFRFDGKPADHCKMCGTHRDFRRRAQERMAACLAKAQLPTEPDDDQLCVVCMDQPKSCVFVHGNTGHHACCMDCSNRIMRDRRRCVLCNQRVERIIELYGA